VASGRVLVTGAEGFVGGALVGALRARGADVVAPVRSVFDLTDVASIDAAVAAATPSQVVHLGAVTHLPSVLAEPTRAFDVNVLGTQRLLDAVRRRAPGARVLVVSSCSVFGSPEPSSLPLREDAPRRSAHPYGVQKIAVEDLAARYAEDFDLDVVVARPFNHVGPGQRTRFAVSFFAREIARRERGGVDDPLRVGNLEPRRELMHVDDVVDAYSRLLDARTSRGVYHVASGRSVRIGEALDHLLSLSSARVEVVPDPALHRPMDAPDLTGDASRLTEETGWRPVREWRDTLAEILEDARRRAAETT